MINIEARLAWPTCQGSLDLDQHGDDCLNAFHVILCQIEIEEHLWYETMTCWEGHTFVSVPPLGRL